MKNSYPSIPDPNNSPESQLATLMALTQAVRAMQTTLNTLTNQIALIQSQVNRVTSIR